MAFVIDIRRQAVMQHLMFKAVFELAKDRADFISLLFSKPRPEGIETEMSIGQIWQAFSAVRTDTAGIPRNAARIIDQLTKTHGFTFSEEESAQLATVLDAFARFGPDISTRSGSGRPGMSFADLTGWSLDAAGHPQSFLATEDDYHFVKTLQEKNLVVPVSGDFGGPKALRAIGMYVREHGGTVSAYYVSNVEQYLFQDSKLRAFYDNVATLPTSETSVFIRPYSSRYRFGGQSRSLCPIGAFLTAMSQSAMPTYNDSLSCAQ